MDSYSLEFGTTKLVYIHGVDVDMDLRDCRTLYAFTAALHMEIHLVKIQSQIMRISSRLVLSFQHSFFSNPSTYK